MKVVKLETDIENMRNQSLEKKERNFEKKIMERDLKRKEDQILQLTEELK